MMPNQMNMNAAVQAPSIRTDRVAPAAVAALVALGLLIADSLQAAEMPLTSVLEGQLNLACPLQPIAIASDDVDGVEVGETIESSFLWLSWQGSNSANALAATIGLPSQGGLYTHPDEPSDHQLDPGDWVETVPGRKSSNAIRSAMADLAGETIALVSYADERGQGSHHDVQADRILLAVLHDSDVKKGEITWTYQGDASCYNQPPTALDGEYSLDEDTSIQFALAGSDPDGDALDFSIVQPPEHGTLSGNAPDLTYQPNPNYYGMDTLTFVVSDGQATSGSAAVTFSVQPINDPPTINDLALVVDEDGSVTAPLETFDVDGDALTVTVLQDPIYGQLLVEGDSVVYTPTADYFGLDIAQLEVSDGNGGTDQATVDIQVNQVDFAPEIAFFDVSLDEINLGMSVTLSWEVVDSSQVVIEPDIGIVPATGSIDVIPTDDVVYQLVATGVSADPREASAERLVQVVPPPSVAFSVDALSVEPDTFNVLRWTVADAASVDIEPDLGPQPSVGAATILPGDTTTYTLTAVGRGPVPETVMADVTVEVRHPPTVTLAVDRSTVASGESVTLTWEATRADNVTITPDIGAVASNGSVTVGVGAATVFTIEAVNAFATDTASQTVKVDPQLMFLSPEAGTLLTGDAISVTGTAADNGDFTFTLNRDPLTVIDGGFDATLAVKEGNNPIRVEAIDSLGHVFAASTYVRVDTTPPVVSVDFPKPGAVVSTATITVSGTIQDIVTGTIDAADARVTVNGVEAIVDNRSFAASNISLTPGDNLLQVEAFDAAGNSAVRSLMVRYELPGPRQMVIASGDGQTGQVTQSLAEPLTVLLTDEQGAPVPNKLVLFSVTQGSGKVVPGLPTSADRRAVVSTGADGRANISFQVGQRSGSSNHRVTAKATGFGDVVFSASATPMPANKVSVVAGDNQWGAINTPLARPLVVAATDASGNVVNGAEILFQVTRGTGTFANNSAQWTAFTNADGEARAEFIVGPETEFDQLVTATLVGHGNIAQFAVRPAVPGAPEDTTISGIVLDNQDEPLPDVTVYVPDSAAVTTTDAQGRFLLTDVPPGLIHVVADGTTTTSPGSYPKLSFELHTVPGVDHPMDTVYLVALNESGIFVSETEGGTLTIDEIPGFALEVAPNSVTFPDGSREGVIAVTPVNSSRVPMPPPMGMQPQVIVTIQPADAHFDPPARMTLPNVDGYPAGAQVEMFSFDHDLEAFVSIGVGTVSEDSRTFTSNVGMGVVKAGWHCGSAPENDTCAANCEGCGVVLNSETCSCEFDQLAADLQGCGADQCDVGSKSNSCCSGPTADPGYAFHKQNFAVAPNYIRDRYKFRASNGAFRFAATARTTDSLSASHTSALVAAADLFDVSGQVCSENYTGSGNAFISEFSATMLFTVRNATISNNNSPDLCGSWATINDGSLDRLTVSLHPTCTPTITAIAHELGHLVGLVHRPDDPSDFTTSPGPSGNVEPYHIRALSEHYE